MTKHILTKPLVILLTMGLTAAAVTLAPAQDAGTDGWVKFSDNLLNTLEGYRTIQPGARGIGGLAVDRLTGDLYMCPNGWPFGAYRSADAGQTWERIDKGGEVIGGWHRSYSISMDQMKSGRMVFFRKFPPPHRKYEKDEDPMKSISVGLTTDGGESWFTDFPLHRQPYGAGGWSHGMVHWVDENPSRMIGHAITRHGIMFTIDGGENWADIKEFDPIFEASYAVEQARWLTENKPEEAEKVTFPTTRGYGISAEGIFIGNDEGIHFRADDAEEFERVADYQVGGYTPIRFGSGLYWGTETGIIASMDEGKTWNLVGAELPGIVKGPFFGGNTEMVVVTRDGVFGTRDACQTWQKLSDLFWVPDTYKHEFEQVLRRHDYAWDPTRNILYVSGLAGSAYKKQLDW